MNLKQLVHYPETNSIEVTWTNQEGHVIRCHSYADVQMNMLRDDIAEYGGNVAEYESVIAIVEAGIVPYVEPELSFDDKVKLVETAVTDMLNAEALKKGYRNDITGQGDIKSAALRAGYPGPFQAEGIVYANWMDSVWFHCYEILAEVQSGTRSEPTIEELLAELPALVLP